MSTVWPRTVIVLRYHYINLSETWSGKKTGNISMSLKITSSWYSCNIDFGVVFFFM